MVREGLLPEAYEVVLQSHDLPQLRERVAQRHDGEYTLTNLINRLYTGQ